MINTENISGKDFYTLQLTSEIECLNEVEDLVDKLVSTYQIDDEVYAIIMTCLSEIVSNAVSHGNKNDSNKKIYINVEIVNRKKIIFTITDEGEGFDFHETLSSLDIANPNNLSGRGLFIVTNLADQCIFNGKGNEVEIHFRI